MGQLTTKFDPKNGVNAGFVIAGNAITPVTVTDVKIDESATATTITNTVTYPDGSNGSYDESAIFTTPADAAQSLIDAYNAKYPAAAAQPAAAAPATPPAPPADPVNPTAPPAPAQ